MRHGVFNMIYFSFYHNVKSIVPTFEVNVGTHFGCCMHSIQ